MIVAIEVMRSGGTVSQIGTFNNLLIAKLKKLSYYLLELQGAWHTALLPSYILHSNQTLLCNFQLLDICPILYLISDSSHFKFFLLHEAFSSFHHSSSS